MLREVVGDGVLDVDVTRLLPMLTPMHRAVALRRASRDEAAGRGIGAAVVEAHAVDDGAVGDEPEQPRARVAGLRERR